MSPSRPHHTPRELSGSLLLRPMRTSDLDEMVEFVTRVFGTVMNPPGPDVMAGIWARELLRGDHPTTNPEDGTVVVDTASGKIVACCFLISQMWRYGEVALPVGRPELIASDPAYRGRGLIRELLTSIHSLSAALGHQMQALTGIPYYYRQYGYEPALITDFGRRGSITAPQSVDGETKLTCSFRHARETDLEFVTRMYERAARRAMISAVRNEAIWRHEIFNRDPGGDYWHEVRIIEDADGGAIGCVAHVAQIRGKTLTCTVAELEDDNRWADVGPQLLAYLRGAGIEAAAQTGEPCDSIEFDWTPGHPFVDAVAQSLPESGEPFTWYVRISEIDAFLRHISPALEARLFESDFRGYTGETTITFYPAGLRVGFENGRLVVAESLKIAPHRSADAAFPGRSMLQLVLGSRSIDELIFAFPFETFVREDSTRQLLATLFPKRPSAVWPVA